MLIGNSADKRKGQKYYCTTHKGCNIDLSMTLTT